MNLDSRWVLLVAACGGLALAFWLRSNRPAANAAHKAELHEWENEGGNLAPSAHAAEPAPAKDFT